MNYNNIIISHKLHNILSIQLVPMTHIRSDDHSVYELRFIRTYESTYHFSYIFSGSLIGCIILLSAEVVPIAIGDKNTTLILLPEVYVYYIASQNTRECKK